MTRQQIFESAKLLSREEQIDLAMELWDLAEPLTQEELLVSDELKAELDRRLAEADANSQPAEDWSVTRAKLLRGEF